MKIHSTKEKIDYTSKNELADLVTKIIKEIVVENNIILQKDILVEARRIETLPLIDENIRVIMVW